MSEEQHDQMRLPDGYSINDKGQYVDPSGNIVSKSKVRFALQAQDKALKKETQKDEPRRGKQVPAEKKPIELPDGYTMNDQGQFFDPQGQVVSKSKLKDAMKAQQIANKKANKAPSASDKPVGPIEISGNKDCGYYERHFANPTMDDDPLHEHLSLESKYPHKYHVTHSLKLFEEQYGYIKAQEELTEIVSVAARVSTIRGMGKMIFITLNENLSTLQLMFRPQMYENPEKMKQDVSVLNMGDIVGATGYPTRSKSGELSLIVKSFRLLCPCLHQMPKVKLEDQEVRYRQRFLDLIVNKENRKIFETRATIIKMVRKYLDDREFIEVETPIMWHSSSGATAKPFKTHHNALGIDLNLRVSPELFLKMLIAGGMSRVYELGKQFRNEGIDLTHNPEFTSCEFYMSYADYFDLMDLTENMLQQIVLAVKGTLKFPINVLHKDGTVTQQEIDFSSPWQRIDMIAELEKKINFKFPELNDSEEVTNLLIQLCKQHEVEVEEPRIVSRMLDKLVGKFVEPMCVNPTFLINHPQVMSPLAKWSRDRPDVVERFELFINGLEYCNAYTELNVPIVQRNLFYEQVLAKNKKDDEAMPYDELFCTALEYGLPPTAGWGLGIDRFVMLLTNQVSIREVLLFPLMTPSAKTHGHIIYSFVSEQDGQLIYEPHIWKETTYLSHHTTLSSHELDIKFEGDYENLNSIRQLARSWVIKHNGKFLIQDGKRRLYLPSENREPFIEFLRHLQ